jgi:hypothetical protein
MQPGGPMQMPVGAPIPGAPGAAAPVSQPAPAPAPVAAIPPMPNAYANHILQPSGGGYGVRNMMPAAMPSPGSGLNTGAPNPFNALRMRMGLQSL